MRIVIAATALLLGVACSTTSTVRFTDGTEEEMNLVGGDEAFVVARTSRQDTAIPRDEIADIDYPGNAAGTTGLLLTLYGVPNGLLGFSTCDDSLSPGWCYIGSWAPLAVGLPLMIEGYSRWSDAKSRARASVSRHRRARARLDPIPYGPDEARPPPEPTPRLDLDEIPVACHALIQRDQTKLLGYAIASSVDDDCAMKRDTKTRAPFQNEVLRIERFDGKAENARLVVRDIVGSVWTIPCVCLAPK